MNASLQCLQMLTRLPVFKMFNEGETLIIEASGIKYKSYGAQIESELIDAYLYIAARIEAREIVKRTKETE